ncbi:acyl-CoA carboxylase subunit epsilon [Intrasporangium calvum]|uniref:acyl-CoA carboxylase subunit epsilon n=1 Tax=Intrasporangium calvum TaxID=53358 RepID=UPI00030E0876|nr:acyl-CoA carboxylase subunit epsilon [Intrasporangium calvum]
MRAQREQREPGEARDAVRVLRGNPAAEEIAALVAVLSAVGGGEEAGLPRARSAWSDPAWRLVGPQARRGGWRGSSLPR